MLSIVYMKNSSIDKAEKVLKEYIKLYGKTGIILTNLAKVYYEQGSEERGLAALWEGLCIDPNQDNGLPWWAVIHADKYGKEGYINALKKASEIEGSYLPQLYLARHHLENKELDQAKELYSYILDIAEDKPQTLYIISGDLGQNGYIKELIEIVDPIYDIYKHDLRTGLNLLQAYLHRQDYLEGQKLLNRIMQIHRPDLKDYLMDISNQFERIKNDRERIEIPEGEIKYELVSLNKPIWYYGLKSPDWILSKKNRNKKIGFLVFSNSGIKEKNQASAEREDDMGRLTRSIPLLMLEIFLFFSDLEPTVFIPIAAGIRPMVSGQEWQKDFLHNLMREQHLDYLVSGDISPQAPVCKTKIMLMDKKNNSDLLIENEFNEDSLEKEIIPIISDVYCKITGNGQLNRIKASRDYYQIPEHEYAAVYLTALGQSLMQTFVENQIVKYDSLWGERNILNWYLQMSLSMPENLIPRILFISGLAKSKAYGSEIYKEFKEQAIKLITDKTIDNKLLEEFLPFVYKIFDMSDEFDACYCNKSKDIDNKEYLEWLKSC